MEVDRFEHLLVPVIGGLGTFILGLELMSNGIQTSRSAGCGPCWPLQERGRLLG